MRRSLFQSSFQHDRFLFCCNHISTLLVFSLLHRRIMALFVKKGLRLIYTYASGHHAALCLLAVLHENTHMCTHTFVL